MGLARYAIDLSPGSGKIVVNGDDLSNIVSAIAVQSSTPDFVPVVSLRMVPGSEAAIEGEGIVHIEHPPSEEGLTAEDFLSAIDPGVLDQTVLEGLGLGESGGADAYLKVLLGWARGD